MSLYVEPSIMCDECEQIEGSGTLLNIDGHKSFPSWIKLELQECFPGWKIKTSNGVAICPECLKGKTK